MDKKHANDWFNPQPADYIGTGLAGIGLGLGARGIRHLLDLRKKRDLPPEVPAVPSNRTPLPVEVSPEEATQLEQSGVTVKHAATFLDNMARGALLVPAAYAGWSMLDSHLAAKRKALAQKGIDSARARLQGLMSDQPLPEDQGLHSAMKVAEAHYFGEEKRAWDVGDIPAAAAQGVANSSAVNWLGWPLGISGALLGLSAYNRVQGDNKYRKSVGALNDYVQHQPARPAEAEIQPVVHDKKKEEPLQPSEHIQFPQAHMKSAALEQPANNAPKPKKMKTPVLQTNKDRLVKKLDEIPLAPTKTDSDK